METIYFYGPGTCSLTGLVALEWLGDEYRVVRVEREMRSSPEYKRVNPWAKVPAMRVDGVFLAENAAILAHLAARPGGEGLLPPPGTPERDRANQWLSYIGSGFHAAFGPFFTPSRYVKDEALYPAIKESAVEQIRTHYAYVDGRLGGQRYLLGENRSALDGYFYALSRWGKKLFDLPNEFPNVARHQVTMEADPAVVHGLALEKDGASVPARGGYRGHVELASLEG
jgi:glutathione S-transferase